MHTLYSMQSSGNCYKPRLLMHQLGLAFRLVDTDSFDGSTRTPEFLALNPNGKVPLLVLPDGRRLAESNAMLLHLAEGIAYLPADAYERALSTSGCSSSSTATSPISPSRVHGCTSARRDAARSTRRGSPNCTAAATAALAVMEERLAGHDWLAGDAYSVADIALYAYTHVAGEGDFDLAPYPGCAHGSRGSAAEPGYVSMDWRPDGLPVRGRRHVRLLGERLQSGEALLVVGTDDVVDAPPK